MNRDFIVFLYLLVSEGWDELAVLAAVFIFSAKQCHGWVAPLMRPQPLHGHEDAVALSTRVTPSMLQLVLWHRGPRSSHEGRCPSFDDVRFWFQCLCGGGSNTTGRWWNQRWTHQCSRGSLQVVCFSRFLSIQVAVSKALWWKCQGDLADFLLQNKEEKMISNLSVLEDFRFGEAEPCDKKRNIKGMNLIEFSHVDTQPTPRWHE